MSMYRRVPQRVPATCRNVQLPPLAQRAGSFRGNNSSSDPEKASLSTFPMKPWLYSSDHTHHPSTTDSRTAVFVCAQDLPHYRTVAGACRVRPSAQRAANASVSHCSAARIALPPTGWHCPIRGSSFKRTRHIQMDTAYSTGRKSAVRRRPRLSRQQRRVIARACGRQQRWPSLEG